MTKKIINIIVAVCSVMFIIMMYFNYDFGIPVIVTRIALCVIVLYYVLFNKKFWLWIGNSLNFIFDKKHRWLTILFGIAIMWFHFTFYNEIDSIINQHNYTEGRDKLISSHTETTDQGDDYEVVDTWYDVHHELHRYTSESHSEVAWLDSNNVWHKNKIHQNFGLFILAIYGLILFAIYKYIKKSEAQKQQFEKINLGQ